VVERGLVLGLLLLETHIRVAAFEKLSDEMLVDDVPLELGGFDNAAMAELKVLDKETCAMEGLIAANTGEFLVNLVVLS
jgi:hypothetical protein